MVENIGIRFDDMVSIENKKDFILFDNEVKDDVSEILSDTK